MAVLLECATVVVRRAAVEEKYPGGWRAFCSECSGRLCADEQLFAASYMSGEDARIFCEFLAGRGLGGGQAQPITPDFAFVGQGEGHWPDWLQLVRAEVPGGGPIWGCHLTGTDDVWIHTPSGWSWERSMSNPAHSHHLTDEEAAQYLEFLGNRDGVDTYRDRRTGKLAYVARVRRPGTE